MYAKKRLILAAMAITLAVSAGAAGCGKKDGGTAGNTEQTLQEGQAPGEEIVAGGRDENVPRAGDNGQIQETSVSLDTAMEKMCDVLGDGTVIGYIEDAYVAETEAGTDDAACTVIARIADGESEALNDYLLETCGSELKADMDFLPWKDGSAAKKLEGMTLKHAYMKAVPLERYGLITIEMYVLEGNDGTYLFSFIF